MSNTYQSEVQKAQEEINQSGNSWHAISAESVARMRLMNRFQNGLDIARYTANIMRKDMEEYDADPSKYTDRSPQELPGTFPQPPAHSPPS